MSTMADMMEVTKQENVRSQETAKFEFDAFKERQILFDKIKEYIDNLPSDKPGEYGKNLRGVFASVSEHSLEDAIDLARELGIDKEYLINSWWAKPVKVKQGEFIKKISDYVNEKKQREGVSDLAYSHDLDNIVLGQSIVRKSVIRGTTSFQEVYHDERLINDKSLAEAIATYYSKMLRSRAQSDKRGVISPNEAGAIESKGNKASGEDLAVDLLSQYKEALEGRYYAGDVKKIMTKAGASFEPLSDDFEFTNGAFWTLGEVEKYFKKVRLDAEKFKVSIEKTRRQLTVEVENAQRKMALDGLKKQIKERLKEKGFDEEGVDIEINDKNYKVELKWKEEEGGDPANKKEKMETEVKKEDFVFRELQLEPGVEYHDEMLVDVNGMPVLLSTQFSAQWGEQNCVETVEKNGERFEVFMETRDTLGYLTEIGGKPAFIEKTADGKCSILRGQRTFQKNMIMSIFSKTSAVNRRR